jgi:hypothetical protein
MCVARSRRCGWPESIRRAPECRLGLQTRGQTFGAQRATPLSSRDAFLIISYYTVIAGWVLAYTWKCATGQLTGLSPPAVRALFRDFLASPLQVGAWHAGFVVLAAAISARGLNRGIEVANKIRAPGLLGSVRTQISGEGGGPGGIVDPPRPGVAAGMA